MSATFTCPNCGRIGSIKSALPTSAKLRCPGCKMLFSPGFSSQSASSAKEPLPSHAAISAAFATLGLPTETPSEQVKQAYRDLVQVWHPDRFTHNLRLANQAQAKMIEINGAYAIIRDHLASAVQQAPNDTQCWDSDSDLDEFLKTVIPSQPRNTSGPDSREWSPPDDSGTDSSSEPEPSEPPWYKDPILKYAWRIPAVILSIFFIFISRDLIYSFSSKSFDAFQSSISYLRENGEFVLVCFVGLPVGVVALAVFVLRAMEASIEKQAIATRCPYCGKLSALEDVGEHIISQTPTLKTVTRRSTGVGMFDGQMIPTVQCYDEQISVIIVIYKSVLQCKFCNRQTMSASMQRELVP